MARQCSRPGCGDAASATMGYEYATSTVWLVEVIRAADPNTYDLCPRHADRLSVPRGWELRDRRRPAATSVVARSA